ncbi:MAG: hypothetical protein LBL45_03430 [Treponema sp.]|nr:hypothetical protein [Treponema sp.]
MVFDRLAASVGVSLGRALPDLLVLETPASAPIPPGSGVPLECRNAPLAGKQIPIPVEPHAASPRRHLGRLPGRQSRRTAAIFAMAPAVEIRFPRLQFPWKR